MKELLRRPNVARILGAVRRGEATTQRELVRRLELTKSSVSDAVQDLIRCGLLEEGEAAADGTVGRRPRLLRFRPDFGQIISLDIGGTSLRGAVLDMDGRMLARDSVHTVVSELGERTRAMIERLLSSSHVTRPLGIVVGAAGVVDRRTQTVLDSPSLGEFNSRTIKDVLSYYDLPWLIENDVNLAALGEHWLGAAKGYKNVICLAVGTGIGAGIVIDGRIYRGAHGFAGEVGYFYQKESPPLEHYTSYGDLETVAAGAGLAMRAASDGEIRGVGNSKVTGSDVVPSLFARARAGEDFSRSLADAAAVHLGIAVGNMISLIDPDVLVLSGGIGFNQADYLLPRVREIAEKIAPPGLRGRLRIVRGGLGDDAGLVGGAHLVQLEQGFFGALESE